MARTHFLARLEPEDCPILRLGVSKLFRLSSIRKAWTLLRFMRNHRIDVLQTHFPDSTYFGVPIARLAGVPRVVRTAPRHGLLDGAARPAVGPVV